LREIKKELEPKEERPSSDIEKSTIYLNMPKAQQKRDRSITARDLNSYLESKWIKEDKLTLKRNEAYKTLYNYVWNNFQKAKYIDNIPEGLLYKARFLFTDKATLQDLNDLKQQSKSYSKFLTMLSCLTQEQTNEDNRDLANLIKGALKNNKFVQSADIITPYENKPYVVRIPFMMNANKTQTLKAIASVLKNLPGLKVKSYIDIYLGNRPGIEITFERK
jgi:hypothetical protein